MLLTILDYFSLYTALRTKRHNRAMMLKKWHVLCCSIDSVLLNLTETKVHYKLHFHTGAFAIYIENMLPGNILHGPNTKDRFFSYNYYYEGIGQGWIMKYELNFLFKHNRLPMSALVYPAITLPSNWQRQK